MSDYLTSLAARALGVTDVARPRRSMFEPRRGAPEPVAASEPARSSRLDEAPMERDEGTSALTAPPPVLAPRQARRPPSRAEEPPAPKTPAKPSRREPLRASVRRRRLSAPAPPVAAPAAKPESAAPAQSEVEERSPDPVAASPPGSRRTDAQVAPTLLLSARPPRGADPSEAASPPTVRVTIGRVDVRAVMPERQPEPKRQPRLAPRMSLDDYLSAPRSAGR